MNDIKEEQIAHNLSVANKNRYKWVKIQEKYPDLINVNLECVDIAFNHYNACISRLTAELDKYKDIVSKLVNKWKVI
jgi:hypothetical protein